MEATSIRPAISSDIPTLMALDHGYSTDHVWQMSFERSPSQVGATFREVRLPRPMRVTYPRDPNRLADEWTLRSALLVAENGETLIGYVSIVEGPSQAMGWITDLVIDLRHRRQGVASRLLAAAREWSRERGITRLFLEMQSKNYPAVCLARKMGFVFSGYSDQYYQDQDIALFFSLSLS
ncbi:MAG: GNAT family N-acetyltransferase [Anaerolineales bacterium]|nr:GNAT family N-acetyltransferase [Anaerolineales bacterium]